MSGKSEWTLVEGDLDTRPPAARIQAKEDGTFGEAAVLETRPGKPPVSSVDVEVPDPPNRARLKAEGLFGVEADNGGLRHRDEV